MEYNYKTNHTCSTNIKVELDGNIIKHVKFTGGCDGNLKAIQSLVEGLTVEEVEINAKELPAALNRLHAQTSLLKL